MIYDREDLHPYNRVLHRMIGDAIHSGNWDKPKIYATALITTYKVFKFDGKDLQFFLLRLLELMEE